MEINKLLLGLLIAILLMNVLMVGVYLGREGLVNLNSGKNIEANQTAPANQSSENETAEKIITVKIYENCSSLNGTTCNSTAVCGGNWLDASDSLSCCSSNCSVQTSKVISIELFELNPEEKDLGDIV